MTKPDFENIGNYISTFPEAVQERLQQIRTTIQQATPAATEAISYAMPTFKLNGKNLVHFAAFKNHIGFYPTPNSIEGFREELSQYEGAKGSVQFPFNKPLPLHLIARIVKYRAEQMEVKRKKKP